MATTKRNAPTARRWGWCETVHDFEKGKRGARRNRRRREAQAWKAQAKAETD